MLERFVKVLGGLCILFAALFAYSYLMRKSLVFYVCLACISITLFICVYYIVKSQKTNYVKVDHKRATEIAQLTLKAQKQIMGQFFDLVKLPSKGVYQVQTATFKDVLKELLINLNNSFSSNNVHLKNIMSEGQSRSQEISIITANQKIIKLSIKKVKSTRAKLRFWLSRKSRNKRIKQLAIDLKKNLSSHKALAIGISEKPL